MSTGPEISIESVMTFKAEDISRFLKAVRFLAGKHKTQRRKGAEGFPYVSRKVQRVSRRVAESGTRVL